MLLATSDLTHGHLLLADWLFLIGAILAVLAAIAVAPVTNMPKLAAWGACLVALALACFGFAWLVL
jgi:hypothetical protein